MVYVLKYVIEYNNICFNVWFYMIDIDFLDKLIVGSIVYDY